MTSQNPAKEASISKQLKPKLVPPHKFSASGKVASICEEDKEYGQEDGQSSREIAASKLKDRYPEPQAARKKKQDNLPQEWEEYRPGGDYCEEVMQKFSDQPTPKAGSKKNQEKPTVTPEYRFKKGQQVTKKNEKAADKTRKIRKKYWICCRRPTEDDPSLGEYRLKKGPREEDGWVGGVDDYVSEDDLLKWRVDWVDGETYK